MPPNVPHIFSSLPVLSPLVLEEEDWEVASPLQERPPSLSLSMIAPA
jgi:hypothetical protein